MIILDGKKVASLLIDDLKEKLVTVKNTPVFCDVLVGSDPASVQYVQMKKKMALSLGFSFHDAVFPEHITTEELVEEIKKIHNLPYLSGLIVQLPLPPHIDMSLVLNSIDPLLDVDCLGENKKNLFYKGETYNGSPAALAVMALLDSNKDVSLEEKNIVVVGRGELVGRPVAHLLSQRGLKPIVLSKETEDKDELIKNADIIVSATGVPKIITGNVIKEGMVIIDAGTAEWGGGIVGDVDFETVKDKVFAIAKVPGGVGPVTIAMLFRNVYSAYIKRYES